MTAITFDKTWAAEEKIISSSLSAVDGTKEALLQIKTLLKNHNWTHVASCDRDSVSVVEGTDLWIDRGDIIGAVPGTAHSWIVLKNTAIAANFQICFDICSATHTNIGVQVSYNAGFTSGTTLNRPTATDETVLLGAPAGAWISYSTAYGIVITMYYSSDFKCNRIFFCPTVVSNISSTAGGCFIFDVPKDPVSWWDNPFFGIAGIQTLNYTKHNDPAIPPNVYTRINSTTTNICLGSVGTSLGVYGNTSYGDSQDHNGAYILSPVPLISITSIRPGILGLMYDSYWVASTIREGTYIPTTAGSRRLFVMGNMAQANDGNKRSI